MKTLLLIDGHAMIHRAFHALPTTLTTKNGEPTGAIYGFFLMLQKVIGDFKPSHIAVAFDTPKPTFRKTLFKGYLLAQLIGRLNPDPRHNPEQALKRQEAKQNARQLYEGFAGLQQAAEL